VRKIPPKRDREGAIKRTKTKREERKKEKEKSLGSSGNRDGLGALNGGREVRRPVRTIACGSQENPGPRGRLTMNGKRGTTARNFSHDHRLERRGQGSRGSCRATRKDRTSVNRAQLHRVERLGAVSPRLMTGGGRAALEAKRAKRTMA